MDNLAWMKALKKYPIHKKIMATRDDYVNNNMFDPDEAIAAAVKKRKFLLKRLLEDQEHFPEQRIQKHNTKSKINYCPN